MKYYLDTEFDGFGGKLISLALVPHDRTLSDFYITANDVVPKDKWVRANVMTVLSLKGAQPILSTTKELHKHLVQYLHNQNRPSDSIHVVSDWPDDIRYLMACLITGPGEMVNLKRMTMEFIRCETYPTDMLNAVQHNALWDARVLRHVLS